MKQSTHAIARPHRATARASGSINGSLCPRRPLERSHGTTARSRNPILDALCNHRAATRAIARLVRPCGTRASSRWDELLSAQIEFASVRPHAPACTTVRGPKLSIMGPKQGVRLCSPFCSVKRLLLNTLTLNSFILSYPPTYNTFLFSPFPHTSLIQVVTSSYQSHKMDRKGKQVVSNKRKCVHRLPELRQDFSDDESENNIEAPTTEEVGTKEDPEELPKEEEEEEEDHEELPKEESQDLWDLTTLQEILSLPSELASNIIPRYYRRNFLIRWRQRRNLARSFSVDFSIGICVGKAIGITVGLKSDAPSLHSLHRLHPPRPPLSHRRCHLRPPPRRRPSHHRRYHHRRCLPPSSPECDTLPEAAVLATTDLLQGTIVFAPATNPSPPFALSFLLLPFSPFSKPCRGIIVAARRRGSCAVLLVILCAAHHPLHCHLCIPSLQQRSSQELEHVELADEEEDDGPIFVLTNEWREFFPKSKARRKQGLFGFCGTA
ncbi:hypothetical protein PIB30_081719 [Stylosanthes scabra]|uniref:Uncharacterized protein n=1 Tax=Stylosanthes scabra TaxID=79078 RepID=A0ABU6VRN5_9FABA|nr:hypothetical protein [Stylosanthes scabra]